MKEIQWLINQENGYLLRQMWKCDKRFFKDFFWSIMSHRTTIMKKLSLMKYEKIDKITEKIKHFFEKESFKNFPEKIEKRCFSMVWKIKSNDYICIDEVDIAKPYAKKMEWLKKVRDWSTWNIVNWYMFHWVSIRWIPVILEYEDLFNKFKSEYFWKIIDRILSYTKWIWTFVLDAGYDISSYIDFLNKKVANYIIRAKKDRYYTIVKTGKKLKLKEFRDWIYKVKIENVENYLYLHIKTNNGYDEPIRILSNSKDINTEEYAKRWEIEAIFKTMKQEFQMEKIQTSSLQVLKSIVASIQLAVAISRVIYNQNNSFKDSSKIVLSNRFGSRFHKFTKSLWITMNSNSIIKFISYCLWKLYKTPKCKPQNNTNKNNRVLAQLSLFSWLNFVKTGEI